MWQSNQSQDFHVDCMCGCVVAACCTRWSDEQESNKCLFVYESSSESSPNVFGEGEFYGFMGSQPVVYGFLVGHFEQEEGVSVLKTEGVPEIVVVPRKLPDGQSSEPRSGVGGHLEPLTRCPCMSAA